MMSDTQESTTQPLSTEQLTIFQDIILAAGTVLNLQKLLDQLVYQIADLIDCERVLILTADDENISLQFGATNQPPDDYELRNQLGRWSITLFNAESTPVVGEWLVGKAQTLTADNTANHTTLNWLTVTLPTNHRYSLPLMNRNRLIGLILVDSPDPLTEATHTILGTIAQAVAVVVQNGRVYSKTVHQAEAHMRELTILRQIDRELNDTIEPHHVFQMTLDWALRFTNAQAASIGLYEQDADTMRMIATYGYDIPADQLAVVRAQRTNIAQRVARSGYAEVVPDVSLDKDFIRGASATNSQLSVPVMREDRVIAVISVESKNLNGFTDEHLSFVEKLAARAGVAIDNARLFDETVREREKLSHILNNTADVVIVVTHDDRLMLINPAAFSALRLYPGESYVGHKFNEVFEGTNLATVFQKAKDSDDPYIEEVGLPDDRTFHMNLTRHENVGWIIVMHDITPFKEMDQLKSELIATVSHDLKQPLAVMNGYIELLLMHKKLDTTGLSFVEMVRKSILNMRQLIDDLLDLAKIESGVQLNLESINASELIGDCVDSLQPSIMTKEMEILIDIPDETPPLLADHARLQQVLLNLIGNAVKYTQPEGKVKVMVEPKETTLRILIQDNGMGISPEDQAHIFDRFYRVRRPETDSIDGTGLGLAIVKSLVEAHNGQIGLESRLGEGTTFFLTLPTTAEAEPSSVVVQP